MLRAINIFKEKFADVRYFLAPMAGITDTVFRQLMREMGAQVVISELISAEGLVRGGERTRSMIQFDEKERPVGIQLFGANPMTLVEASKMLEAEGVDFVDLNLGCPVKKVVHTGAGAAWLRDPTSLGKVLSAMKSAITIPLTIKIRTGWDDTCVNAKEVVQVAADSGVSWVAIHGRTRAQGYSGLANWEIIKEVAEWSPIPIIGNGDIVSFDQAKEKIEKGYAHGVMIGRGALKNPWMFKQLMGEACVSHDFLDLIGRHFDLAIAKKDRRRAYLSLKKFMGWYAAGFPNSSVFRRRIFDTQEIDALRGLCVDYFQSMDMSQKFSDASPFLMGGHG